MLERFFPDEYVKGIFDVDYGKLKEKGISCLIFDIDNTIEPYDVHIPSERDVALLTGLKSMGFTVCLVSNNSKERVERFNENLALPAAWRAMKPLKRGVRQVMELVGARAENTAFIGDQVFTDIWCARRMGLYAVLVNPIANKDEFSVRLKRGIEKIIIKKYEEKTNTKP